MKSKRLILVAFLAFVVGGVSTVLFFYGPFSDQPSSRESSRNAHEYLARASMVNPAPAEEVAPLDIVIDENNEEPLPPFMSKALDWLSQAQHPNGGFGAGLHSRQDIRDPHAVKTDAATTAMVGMAFIRTGSTHETGPYHKQVADILNFLLDEVEGKGKAKKNVQPVKQDSDKPVISGRGYAGSSFVHKGGNTQIQSKLGQNIDWTFTSQFLTRSLEFAQNDSELKSRISQCIQTCVKEIEAKQNDDGSMSGGTWAGVLQSSMGNSALEQANAKVETVTITAEKLESSRSYQRSNVSSTGEIKTSAAAGISLYAYSSTNRATASNTRRARKMMDKAKKEGKMKKDAEVTVKNLEELGVEAEEAEVIVADYKANEVSGKQLLKDDVLSGFGNNGGEEFLSYMMSSEALVISGGDEWDEWNEKMHKRLSKIQNKDGSWSGHHCITSPVFCTAAVIMTLATDRDAEYIASSAE